MVFRYAGIGIISDYTALFKRISDNCFLTGQSIASIVQGSHMHRELTASNIFYTEILIQISKRSKWPYSTSEGNEEQNQRYKSRINR